MNPWYTWLPLWMTSLVLTVSTGIAWHNLRETFGAIIDWQILDRWKVKEGDCTNYMLVRLQNVGTRKTTMEFERGEKIDIRPKQTIRMYLGCGSDFRHVVKYGNVEEIIDGFGAQKYVYVREEEDLFANIGRQFGH